MNEPQWKRLISKIREHNVVPIVGSRLLVGADGLTSLQGHVATRLMQDCGMEIGEVPLPPFRELNETVYRLRASVKPQDLYDCVNDAICAVVGARDSPIPTPISQLAEISDFRLFVTLTPDDLLARALRERCAVNEIVHSPSLPSSDRKDLPTDWVMRSNEVYLLYLLGKSRSGPMFAIHDEDVLEYAHELIANGEGLRTFLGELRQRNLLLIGCNFPDWLSRFFLRTTNQHRLSAMDKRAWLIEPLQPQESLTCFLNSYSSETEILSQTSPAEFVAELHKRWTQEQLAAPAASVPSRDAVPSGAMFFISYSRKTDLVRAESLYQALLEQGVTPGDVWFDRTTIEPGQDYQRRILDGINGCRYFLPLISQAVDARDQGFVFKEWRAATERREEMNRDYLLPIVVDPDYGPSLYTFETVWKWRQDHIDFAHAPGGVPNPELKDRFTQMVRSARRGGGRS